MVDRDVISDEKEDDDDDGFDGNIKVIIRPVDTLSSTIRFTITTTPTTSILILMILIAIDNDDDADDNRVCGGCSCRFREYQLCYEVSYKETTTNNGNIIIFKNMHSNIPH